MGEWANAEWHVVWDHLRIADLAPPPLAEKLREIYDSARNSKLFGLETSMSDEERDDRQLESFIDKVCCLKMSGVRASREGLSHRF